MFISMRQDTIQWSMQKKLLDSLEQKITSLKNAPERWHGVPELSRIHATGFKEIHFKPFRIIYQIVDNAVFVHGVFNGRRELRELLERLLLR